MAEATVGNAWCVGIRAKYLGPTNMMGSRWRVWRADDAYRGDPDAITVGYFHELNSGADNAAEAIRQYLEGKDEGWGGRWLVACGDVDGYVAIKVPRA